MCTLIIATGVAGLPDLFVISNRDEFYDRPAARPSVFRRDSMKILAPVDKRAGGTWIGVNARGVFAGITNRFRMPKKPEHRSRGELPFAALEQPTAKAAAQVISAVDPGRYNGFHLVLADADGACVVWNDGQRLRREKLSAGVHVITERSFGAAPSPRLDRLAERIGKLDSGKEDLRGMFRRWMVEHDDEDPLESTCVHFEEQNYGTRSSTIVEVGQRWRFRHADGPPCTAEYGDYSEELAELRRG